MAEAIRDTGELVPSNNGTSPPPEAGKLAVFISYSRDDLGFADQLDAALKLTNFDPTLDRHGISGAENWQEKLGGLIRSADTVVFVLSPSSATSKVCTWEVEEAVRLGKRIIPVVARPLEDTTPPKHLADLNYIFFFEEPRSPGSGFGTGLTRLVAALNTDLAWLREHTRLLQRATEWELGGRLANRLLSGADIADAKAWAARRPKDAPPPTEVHLEFIRASEEREAQARSDERQRLADRERLVHEAEAAHRAKEEATRRLVRRTMIGAGVAATLALMATGFGWYALTQRGEAEAQRQEAVRKGKAAEAAAERAESAAKQATTARNEVLLTQSQYLADMSRQALEQEKDVGTAMLLALEALPDAASDDETTRTRPHWGPAEVSLEAARRLLRERGLLKGHTNAVRSIAVTSDGARIVTGSDDNTARVWDARTLAELAILKGHTGIVWSVAVSPDGKQLITGSDDKTARVWDAATFTERGQLKGHTDAILSVAVTSDGSRIVTSSRDRTARIWDASTLAEVGQLVGHMNAVQGVAVSPDGSRVVTSSGDWTLRVWDAKTFVELGQLKGHTGHILSVAISSDGKRAVSGATDNTARVWDMSTFAELGVLRGHTAHVVSVTTMLGGALILTASSDGTARVWNGKTFAEAGVLKGHPVHVTSIAASSDGASIYTGSLDMTVRSWDPSDFTQRQTILGHQGAVKSVAVSPDGERIVTGADDQYRAGVAC